MSDIRAILNLNKEEQTVGIKQERNCMKSQSVRRSGALRS